MLIFFSSIAAIIIFDIDFFGTIVPRIRTLFLGGVFETNRGVVWEYFFSVIPPIFGYGLGNSNIIFSDFLNSPLISSHLCLFINAWFSLGFLGLILIIFFILQPFFDRNFYKIGKKDPSACGLFAALAAWIIFYLGNAEELNINHAIILGIFWARIHELKKIYF
jgi:O-antigen ligase